MRSEEVKSPKILFLSSINPLVGPGAIAMNYYKELHKMGIDADMLTLHEVERHPEIMYVTARTFWKKLQEYASYLFYKLTKRKPKDTVHLPYCFFYEKENRPPVPVSKVLKKIKKQYDLVIVYFWQKMLSFETVEAIYDKYHPVIFFLSPDFSHMSGGCHFPSDCKGFINGCGCCPAIGSNSKNDFTHWNVIYRKRFYEKVRPVVFGNSYMLSLYRKSFLLKDVNTVQSNPVIDTQHYYPINKGKLRKKYNIPEDKSFVIGFGCQQLNDPRKGMSLLIEAMNILFQQMEEKDRQKIHIVAAGNKFEEIKDKIPFSSQGLGMLPVSQLPEFYSLCQIFACPSINDPGPSMVGQAIACGTPVVGFEMGAMLDCVKNHGTGICVETGNASLLAKAMGEFYTMSNDEYQLYRERCVSLAHSMSTETKIKQWIDTYQYEKNKRKIDEKVD